MRNRIQHFAFSADVPVITSVLTRTWSFLWDFIHDQMPEEMGNEAEIIAKIKDRMLKHEDYIRQRFKDIAPELDRLKNGGALILDCPSCLQEALVIPGEEDPTCRFCRYQDNAAQVADDWATVFVGYPHTDPKERMIAPVLKECPECGMETMIEFEDGGMFPPDHAWACLACGESGPPTTKCHRCGEEFPWEEEVYICPDCRTEEVE